MTEAHDVVEVEPAAPARHSIIWLHGLGADGHDFEPLVPQLRLPAELAVRFVFPHAPIRPVTLNGGYRMRAWFDISSIDRHTRIDHDGIRESVERVHALIRRENARGVPSERIVVAGFSQGGSVALHVAPRYPERLAGLIALSTFELTNAALAAEAADANRSLPVFMAHGRQDNVVAPALGIASRDALVAAGYPVSWHEYEMPHAVCPQEIADLREWLIDTLKKSA
ncbi:MAG TPA: alpha/beta fold hydrolase [Gammaproteobacteria bacterium]|jgi:phospholipase/carboxylesterase|nr:alpha/beta fold hydrolase [Gammaproteobacteria bacterium]